MLKNPLKNKTDGMFLTVIEGTGIGKSVVDLLVIHRYW